MVNIYDNTLATSTNQNKNGLTLISMFSYKGNVSDVCTVRA